MFRTVKFIGLLCIVSLLGTLVSCEEKAEMSSHHPNNWEGHYREIPINDSLQTGKTYLSIYSHIYSFSLEKTHNLTAMASLRNLSETDTIYIQKADYYNTDGQLIRQYFQKPIFLKPLETVEIVIDEADEHGGSGANFIFEWTKSPKSPEPLFEAIMTSLRESQGLSFTTQGIRIE